MPSRGSTPPIPPASLSWSTTLHLGRSNHHLTGDKIVLPPSSLEALLVAASQSAAAAAAASAHLATAHDPSSWDYISPAEIVSRQREQQQQLPHPLTFSITNPKTSRT